MRFYRLRQDFEVVTLRSRFFQQIDCRGLTVKSNDPALREQCSSYALHIADFDVPNNVRHYLDHPEDYEQQRRTQCYIFSHFHRSLRAVCEPRSITHSNLTFKNSQSGDCWTRRRINDGGSIRLAKPSALPSRPDGRTCRGRRRRAAWMTSKCKRPSQESCRTSPSA
jgi:hypothetical protein